MADDEDPRRRLLAEAAAQESYDEEEFFGAEEAAMAEAGIEASHLGQTIRAEELSGGAAAKTTGITPQALKLAEPGLNVPLQKAQQVYGGIGERLYKGAGLRKQERRDLVAARRVLEEDWGISLLREGVRQPSPKLFTGKMPSRTRDTKDATQATVVFGKEVLGWGTKRRFSEKVQTILYGVAEQEKADALTLRRLKSELAGARSITQRTTPKPSDSLLATAKLQEESAKKQLRDMQDRRQHAAYLLGEALEEFGISTLGRAATEKEVRDRAKAKIKRFSKSKDEG
jgi:hypothetical protein